MTPSVTWVSLESAAPMGQQHHESQLQRALRELAGEDWALSARRIGSLRSRARPVVRMPLRTLWAAPHAAAAALATAAYGRAELVHRFDLRLPPRIGREVVTVHDLPPIRFDDEGSLPSWAASGARRAHGVICPSAFAADEVRTLLGVRRVWVVPNGVDTAFSRADPPGTEELGRLGVAQPFVLHAGGATKRKNLAALAEAWRQVATRHDATLVLCGPPDPRRDRLFRDLPRVRYVGHLEPRNVARLMRSAAAVVVPSLYEGFGLPALEGMAAGAPVVASDRGALPEVCGEAAQLVPPTAAGIAEGLAAVLENTELARRLRRAGPERAAPFTWARAAAGTLAAYEEALS